MTTKQLTDLIQLSVKKAVREEMKSFKAQLLIELRSNSKNIISESPRPSKGSNIQKQFREKYQVQRPKQTYSRDPFLNEILSTCEPLEAERDMSYLDEFEDESQIVNLPTTETGQLVNAPKAIVEAMNKDYSQYLSAMEKNKPKPVQKSQINPDARAAVLARMNEVAEDDGGFNEDEDFSFLDNVK